MGNDWQGTASANIARRGFSAFMKGLTSLLGFTTDFSSDIIQGNSVVTRVVPLSDAAVDVQTGTTTAGDRSDPAIIKDIATVPVTVTLNQQPAAGFTLTDDEAVQIASGVKEDTVGNVIAQKGYAVALHMLNYVFNLITNANFSTAILTSAASAFELDDVIDSGATLKSTYSWTPDPDGLLGNLVLQPNYTASLKKDRAVQDDSASGIPVVRTGTIEKVDEFALYDAATLPPAGGTAASENLVGFFAKSSAIAIAMRVVPSQMQEDLIAFEVMEDPITHAVLVYVSWYDRNRRRVLHAFETWYGASKAQTEGLKRIVSA